MVTSVWATPGTVRSWAAPATGVGMGLAGLLHVVGLGVSQASIISVTRVLGLGLAVGLGIWLLKESDRIGQLTALGLTLLAFVILSPVVQPWYLTWGLMVGIGSGAGAVGLAGAVANRWFARRTGFATGLLFAANAAGQLVFLPLFAMLADRYGWRGVSVGVTVAIAAVLPLVMWLLPESPAAIGMTAYGATQIEPLSAQRSPGGNMFGVAFGALSRASRSTDFWLLCLTFGVCGLSTNGLINTHLIAYCADYGIPTVQGASILAVVGAFSLVGSACSGWLCDRYSPRVLLFWYYGLRGLSLVVIPFTSFDGVSLGVFAVFYGLDWVATGPATFALTNEVFGRRDAPVIVSWIFASHQIGGAIAAYGAGAVRSVSGSYMLAFLASGVACLLASLLVLRITPRGVRVAVAAE